MQFTPNPLALQAFKEISKHYPGAMLGGSIGLFLQGIDLGRDISKSDLDVTVLNDALPMVINSFEPAPYNSGADFDYAFLHKVSPEFTIKVEICVDPLAPWAIAVYNGIRYRVRPALDIICFKRRYAEIDKNPKQIQDMKIIDAQLSKYFQ